MNPLDHYDVVDALGTAPPAPGDDVVLTAEEQRVFERMARLVTPKRRAASGPVFADFRALRPQD
jgi:hypothetical protein